MEEEKAKIGIKEEALNQAKWRNGAQAIMGRTGVNSAISA